MGRFLIGKPLHWAALLAACVALWLTGSRRLQVTDFNLHVAILAAVAAGLVAAILLTTKRGEQVTRDPLPAPPEE